MRICAGKRTSFTTLAVLAFAVLFFTGCSAMKMAINEDTEFIDVSETSIALFTVKTENSINPSLAPDVNIVLVNTVGDEKEGKMRFKPDKPYRKERNEYKEYLVSMALKPGEYKLAEILGGNFVPMVVAASCNIPVETEFEIPASSVVYIGRIEAVNRKKESKDEVRAGSLFPLLDQAIAGYSRGTFDVFIYDNYDEDMEKFRESFPVIDGQSVVKRVMPQWVRPLNGGEDEDGEAARETEETAGQPAADGKAI